MSGSRSSITRKIFYSASRPERISGAIGGPLTATPIEVAPVAAPRTVPTAETALTMIIWDRGEARTLLASSVRTITICSMTLVLGALKKILRIILLKI